ncbi:MAG TPA: hypothetical protein VJ777_30160 [Mycobacterium sp.]|nr:hypothetical protein [Mycobacterium sp.]
MSQPTGCMGRLDTHPAHGIDSETVSIDLDQVNLEQLDRCCEIAKVDRSDACSENPSVSSGGCDFSRAKNLARSCLTCDASGQID